MEQTILKVLVTFWACSINKAIVLRGKALNKTTKLTEIGDLCVSDTLTLFFFFFATRSCLTNSLQSTITSSSLPNLLRE